MSRRRGTGHLRKRRPVEPPTCPDEWRQAVGHYFGPVIEVVWLEPGAECPFCDVGTVHEHQDPGEA